MIAHKTCSICITRCIEESLQPTAIQHIKISRGKDTLTTKSAIDPAFTGEGLLQSAEQWETRNRVIVQEMHGLMQKYAERQTGLALEVGCTEGHLTDALAARTDYTWYGVEPVIKSVMRSKGGIEIRPGFAHEISFPNEHFDCVVFANVYEHILPKWRMDSIKEINRVLRPGGVVIGQLPNPYFPISLTVGCRLWVGCPTACNANIGN